MLLSIILADSPRQIRSVLQNCEEFPHPRHPALDEGFDDTLEEVSVDCEDSSEELLGITE